jgi:capsular exopolysaccharide synthesis family protein
MSRISEALKQAGIGPSLAERSTATAGGDLDSFPTGRDSSTARPAPRAEAVPQQAPFVDLQPVERLVIHQDADPVAIEQYRRLAAVLHQAQVDVGTKVIMVASAQASEGKTLTAANLALTLSESYKRRVLLIDADLRRPALSRLFQLPNRPGLSEDLRAAGERALHITNLSAFLALIPGGGADSDPMAGLTSGRMQQIIAQASANFDWVILDTPPVALLSDTHLLVAMVDAAVLVINAGSTPYALVQQAVETLGREKIAGVVLNRVGSEGLADSNYYEYYRAGKQPRMPMPARPVP